jgi:hypothetical protein
MVIITPAMLEIDTITGIASLGSAIGKALNSETMAGGVSGNRADSLLMFPRVCSTIEPFHGRVRTDAT